MKIQLLNEEEKKYRSDGSNIYWLVKSPNLDGAPREVKGFFTCSNFGLESLVGGPIRTEEYYTSSNSLTTLDGCPSVSKSLYINKNNITSLIGIENIISSTMLIDLSENPIAEGGLGLLLIKNLRAVHSRKTGKFGEAVSIINKYLLRSNHEDLIWDCQKELVENGLEEFAIV